MRGDIDGDGKITENDRNRINEHLGGTITLTGADSWCAKVTGNNEISASDLVQLMRYLEGKTNNLTGIPTFADYYNNWTYHKVDDLTGYWTAEIAINGLKTTSDAIVNISNDEGIFYKSELSDGAIRFYATRPPIAEVFATITFKSGTGVITTSYECAKFHASTHSKNGADPIAPTAIGAVGYDAAQNLTDTQKTQARTNINAAPDGFGLGNIGKLLTPEDNLDEVKTNGWYRWERKAPPQGTLPSVIGQSMDATLIRVWGNGAVCYQESINITDETGHGCLCARTIYASTIYPWEWLNPPMQIGVEYRTTERFNGKPVYAQLVNCGALEARTMKTVMLKIPVDWVVSCTGMQGPNTNRHRQASPFYYNNGSAELVFYCSAEAYHYETEDNLYVYLYVTQATTASYALVKYTKESD